MPQIVVEQAVYYRPDGERPHLVGRSRGFADEWLAEAEGLVVGFGDRPVGLRCPAAVFAQPFAADQVAIVQVTDKDAGDSPRAAAFHLSIVPQRAYEWLGGDPFATARRLPPSWGSGELTEPRSLSAEPSLPRTVADVQRVLKRVKGNALAEDQELGKEPERTLLNSESPALLGAVQVLVDGGQIVFERPVADSGLIPDLWLLLPTSTRIRLWPASFAFGNDLHFDALVVPRSIGDDYDGYAREDQAAEYPAGRYEYNLQVAAEHGDQQALDRLFRRRSLAETWRLGVMLLALVFILAVAGRVLQTLAPPRALPQQPPDNGRLIKDKEKP